MQKLNSHQYLPAKKQNIYLPLPVPKFGDRYQPKYDEEPDWPHLHSTNKSCHLLLYGTHTCKVPSFQGIGHESSFEVRLRQKALVPIPACHFPSHLMPYKTVSILLLDHNETYLFNSFIFWLLRCLPRSFKLDNSLWASFFLAFSNLAVAA